MLTVERVATSPIADQKPGTSGLRKKTPTFMQPHYLANFVQSTFNGKRIVIFSGGATKENDEEIHAEARAIRDGGGFGSIMGRNAFQREKPAALKLLAKVMAIYKGE